MTITRMLKQAAICLGLLFWMVVPPAAADTVQIKIATLAPEGSPWMKTFDLIDAELRKKTNDRVRLKVYPGGVLGDERDMLRKMYIGQLHGAVLTSSTLGLIFPEIRAMQAPFLFQTADEVDYVLKQMDGFFRKGIADKGYRVLGWSEGGFVQMMSTTPAETLEKLKKVKVWIWEDAPMARAIFDEAGISAIPLSVPDVLVGLQTGLVDVVYAPPSGVIALQWFTRTRFMNDVPLIYLMGAVVVRNSLIEQLDPAERKLVEETFAAQMDGLKTMVRRQNRDAIRVMTDYGVKILKVPDEEVQRFKALSARALQKMGGELFSPRTLTEVKKHLEQWRSGRKP